MGGEPKKTSVDVIREDEEWYSAIDRDTGMVGQGNSRAEALSVLAEAIEIRDKEAMLNNHDPPVPDVPQF